MAESSYMIRGALPGAMLEHVMRLGDEEREAILSDVSDAVIEEIRSTMALGWVSMTAHMALVDPLRDVVGTERNIALWHETVREYYERPLLRSFTSMAIRLFGMTPRALIKLFPRAYSISTRNLGEVKSFEEDGFLITELSDFPAAKYRFANYVEGMFGATTGAIGAAFSDLDVPVSIDTVDEAQGTVRYRIDTRGL